MTSSRTLVLVHAFPLGARMWTEQRSAFRGWTVLTPSLPGFDGTPIGPGTMEAFASRVHEFLDEHGVERAVIGGLSLGGYVTFAMLRQRPERALGLILADTRCTPDAPEGRDARLRMIDVVESRGPHGVFMSMAPGVMGATTQAARPLVVERVRQLILSQSKAAIEGAIRAMLDRPDSTDLLGAIRVPTLILVGDQDIMTPPSDAERMHAGIPGSELVVLSGAGHLSNMETPYAFNAAVSAFLSTLPAE